jgi:carboxymethylenebutenolidase
MQQLFDRMQNLSAPVLGLFGDKDQSIPAGTVEDFDKLLDQLGVEHEVIVYPDSGHAFFRDRDPNTYRPDAAKDAWERATRFFSKHLK